MAAASPTGMPVVRVPPCRNGSEFGQVVELGLQAQTKSAPSTGPHSEPIPPTMIMATNWTDRPRSNWPGVAKLR